MANGISSKIFNGFSLTLPFPQGEEQPVRRSREMLQIQDRGECAQRDSHSLRERAGVRVKAPNS